MSRAAHPTLRHALLSALLSVLQEDPDEAAEGSLDDEIVEIWENKMQPHMTQSQVRRPGNYS
jgi:hypothetical protein